MVPGAGEVTAYITIPKPTAVGQVAEMISYIQEVAKKSGITREIPIHVLIETHGALRDADAIAALPWMQDFDGTTKFRTPPFLGADNGQREGRRSHGN